MPGGKTAAAPMWCWVTFGEQSMVISRERRRFGHIHGGLDRQHRAGRLVHDVTDPVVSTFSSSLSFEAASPRTSRHRVKAMANIESLVRSCRLRPLAIFKASVMASCICRSRTTSGLGIEPFKKYQSLADSLKQNKRLSKRRRGLRWTPRGFWASGLPAVVTDAVQQAQSWSRSVGRF